MDILSLRLTGEIILKLIRIKTFISNACIKGIKCDGKQVNKNHRQCQIIANDIIHARRIALYR